MKIESITLREIQMPLVHFFETSFGRTYSRQILLITVHCEGINGWAESVSSEGPFFSSEWIESSWATIKAHLASTLLGKTLATATDSAAAHRSPPVAGIEGKWMTPGHISAGTWRHRWDATPLWAAAENVVWWRNCSCGARNGAIAQTWTLRSALLIFVFRMVLDTVGRCPSW